MTRPNWSNYGACPEPGCGRGAGKPCRSLRLIVRPGHSSDLARYDLMSPHASRRHTGASRRSRMLTNLNGTGPRAAAALPPDSELLRGMPRGWHPVPVELRDTTPAWCQRCDRAARLQFGPAGALCPDCRPAEERDRRAAPRHVQRAYALAGS